MMNEEDIEKLRVTSEDLDRILKLIDRVKADSDCCMETVKEAEDECTDILHELELVDLGYHERARLASRLTELRKLRRSAKNEWYVLNPFVEWATADGNRKAIEGLRRALGAMRKAEWNRDNRIYIRRGGENKGELIK